MTFRPTFQIVAKDVNFPSLKVFMIRRIEDNRILFKLFQLLTLTLSNFCLFLFTVMMTCADVTLLQILIKPRQINETEISMSLYNPTLRYKIFQGTDVDNRPELL